MFDQNTIPTILIRFWILGLIWQFRYLILVLGLVDCIFLYRKGLLFFVQILTHALDNKKMFLHWLKSKTSPYHNLKWINKQSTNCVRRRNRSLSPSLLWFYSNPLWPAVIVWKENAVNFFAYCHKPLLKKAVSPHYMHTNLLLFLLHGLNNFNLILCKTTISIIN